MRNVFKNRKKNKALQLYGFFNVILYHAIVIGVLGYAEMEGRGELTTADTILGYMITTFLVLIGNVVLCMPLLLITAMGVFINWLLVFSIPIYLFLALFELCGSEHIHILQYGWGLFIFCVITTPIAKINLESIDSIGFFDI